VSNISRGLTGGVAHHVGTDSTVFRANDDGCPFALTFLLVFSLGRDQRAARPGLQRGEAQALVLACILDPSDAQIVEDSDCEVGGCFGDTEFAAWRESFASFPLDSGNYGRIIFAGG
jgi:hypothetical protein